MNKHPKLWDRLNTDDVMEVRLRGLGDGIISASLDGYGHSGEELGYEGVGVDLDSALEHLESRLP